MLLLCCCDGATLGSEVRFCATGAGRRIAQRGFRAALLFCRRLNKMLRVAFSPETSFFFKEHFILTLPLTLTLTLTLRPNVREKTCSGVYTYLSSVLGHIVFNVAFFGSGGLRGPSGGLTRLRRVLRSTRLPPLVLHCAQHALRSNRRQSRN